MYMRHRKWEDSGFISSRQGRSHFVPCLLPSPPRIQTIRPIEMCVCVCIDVWCGGKQSEKATIAGTGGIGVNQGDGHQKQSTEELMRLSDALEEADALRVAVSSRDAALRAQVRVSWLRERRVPCDSCRALRKQ